jgi:nitroimidazol reductase NimA-like FMN-containing flavoprotein (pyridoxamine 5'-phosphate oxidase superfamily)
MKTELEFDQVKADKVRFLEENEDIVLATSLNNRVTARAVRYASEGLTIIFFTVTNLKKIAQIRANPKVALCLKNASIEGKAEIISQQEEEGKRLAEIIKKKFPNYLEWWHARTAELIVFVKVTPTLVVSYVFKDGKSLLEYLDLQNKTAYQTPIWEEQEY